MAVAHADPEKIALAEELLRKFPPDPETDAIYRVMRTGTPELVPVVTDELLQRVARSAEHLQIMRELGIMSYMIVPLRSRGEVVGTITFVASDRRFSQQDLDGAATIRSGANLLVYSALSEREAAQLSGRSGEMLQASMHRRFSEPFVLERGDLGAVSRAAASIGFSVRRGRRFLYLCRELDQGEAFTRLREELRCEVAVAIGGAAVDAEFLSRADVAIVVPGPDGSPDPELLDRVPGARIAPAPAPEGWAAAIGEVAATLERRPTGT